MRNAMTVKEAQSELMNFCHKGGMSAFELEYIEKDGEKEYCHGDISISNNGWVRYSANSGCVESFAIRYNKDFDLNANLEELHSELTYKIIELGFSLGE